MAGDWIKFEVGTHDKPEVWAIASGLQIDPDAVVGKLLRIWGWFDQHTESGNAPTVTKMLLDRLVGVSGFCDELVKAGWMSEDGQSVSLPNFDRHNGKTAKNRAVTAKRVAAHKAKQLESNDADNAGVTQQPLPKEEKNREENKKEEKDLFSEFWAEYPKKVGKEPARKLWAKLNPDDALMEQILYSLGRHKMSDQWVKDGGKFIPHPSTWLNQKRWDDELENEKPEELWELPSAPIDPYGGYR